MLKKSWPILVLIFLLGAVLCVSSYTDPGNSSQQYSANNAAPVAATATTQADNPGNQAHASKDTPFWRKLVAWPNGVETLGILLTLVCIAWQALLTREAIASAERSSKRELRAYLAVSISSGTFQERDKEIYFCGIPCLVNTGKTPAHRVRYRNNAAILKDSTRNAYSFPPGREEIGDYDVGMNERLTMSIKLEDYIPQEDVDVVMRAHAGRAFYYWGIVSYNDAFGDRHETEFCHRVYFYPDPEKPGEWKINGNYIEGKNKST